MPKASLHGQLVSQVWDAVLQRVVTVQGDEVGLCGLLEGPCLSHEDDILVQSEEESGFDCLCTTVLR